jgi:hypothetical protein
MSIMRNRKRNTYVFTGVVIFVLGLSQVVSGQKSQEQKRVAIPEPLMFDLVRGLGAAKGELEINALGDFPLNNSSTRGVEWAPEIEYALFNNVAVELELPMNNFEIEAYKMAIQWTIGASKNKKFIHGFQILAERYVHRNLLELNVLYVPAYRFNETWSVIGLFGLMIESGKQAANKKKTIVLNASLFADLNERTVVGLEINNSDPTFQGLDDNEMMLLLLPQMHYEFEYGYSLQVGAGGKWDDSEVVFSAVARLIKTF